MSNTDDNFVYDGFDVGDPEIQGWDGTGGGGPKIPPGEHLFEVVGCKVVSTKKGDGKNFEVEYKVVGGESDDTFRQWYLCMGDNFKKGHKARIVQVFRNALRVPMDDNGRFETKNVPGLKMYAVVSHEQSDKYDATTQTTKTYTNVSLSCERPTEDEATAPAASTKAPSAPPSRPPAAPPAARPAARPPAAPPARAR